nr:hypothetical protein [Fodinicola feengrottensis]
MGASGASQLVGRDAEVGEENPPQMPCRQGEPGSQIRLGAVVQCAVDDELHRAAHQLRRIGADGAGHSIGPAAQAGPETGHLGRGRQLEGPHVLGQRLRAAPGPAVDPSGHHRRICRHVSQV